MLRKNSDVHAMIVEQIKDVEKCLINFENFMRAATTPETVPETLRALCEGVMEAENAAEVADHRRSMRGLPARAEQPVRLRDRDWPAYDRISDRRNTSGTE